MFFKINSWSYSCIMPYRSRKMQKQKKWVKKDFPKLGNTERRRSNWEGQGSIMCPWYYVDSPSLSQKKIHFIIHTQCVLLLLLLWGPGCFEYIFCKWPAAKQLKAHYNLTTTCLKKGKIPHQQNCWFVLKTYCCIRGRIHQVVLKGSGNESIGNIKEWLF